MNKVYHKLQKIRDEYYFKHPMFKYLFNKDASTHLKDKIREKQHESKQGTLDINQYYRFKNGTIEDILHELLDEIRIEDAEDTLAKLINKDIDEAQRILKKK